MSKDKKDQADWRSGSDAFFRAVRADHEATAVDFARVEAELARRLAAGAPAQPTLDGDLAASIAEPARAFTFGKVAKLWVGLTLLAAGSYGVLRTVESEPARSSQVAGSLPPAPPPPSAAAMNAQPDAVVADSSDTQLPHTDVRDEAAPQPPSPRTLHRDASESKRANIRRREPTRSHTPAPTNAANLHSNANVAAAPSSPASARPDANVASAAVLPASTGASAETKAAPSVSAAADASRVGAARTGSDAPVASRATNASARGSQRQIDRRNESAEASDGRAELALIERMQAAMRAAKATEALALVAEHAKRWPHGVFVEEREAVRAIASCTLRSADAATHAQVFLSKHRRAPTAPRVAEVCAPLLAAAGITVP